MKVAFVLATTAGGTGRHVSQLAAGCVARGVSVLVFGPAGTRDEHGFGASGAMFVPVEIGERPRPAQDARTAMRLRRLLGRSDADVVHAHGLRAGALTAVALRGVLGLRGVPVRRGVPSPSQPGPVPRQPPLVVTVHNAPPPGGGTGAVYRLLETVVARGADVVLCVSADLQARMRQAGARDVRPALVPAAGRDVPRVPTGGPDPGDHGSADPGARGSGATEGGVGGSGTAGRDTVRREFGADDGAMPRPMVLAAGRLTEQKGFDVLLAAVARWRDLSPPPLLVLAGDGPLAASLAADAADLGDAVRMVGHREDLPDLVAAADVVVVSSRWEGQPLFVQEVLRAGRALVATRVGGLPDVTGEDAAVLVPPDDPDRLAAAVRGVLTDPALARRLSRAAVVRARELPSEHDAVDAALTVYRSLARGDE